jgi:hypothetical protein
VHSACHEIFLSMSAATVSGSGAAPSVGEVIDAGLSTGVPSIERAARAIKTDAQLNPNANPNDLLHAIMDFESACQRLGFSS